MLYKECQVLPALSLILRTACSSLNCKIQKLIKMLKYSKNLELSATSTYNIKKNHREVTFLSFSCMSIFPCTLSQSVVSEKGHTVPDCPSICLFFFFPPLNKEQICTKVLYLHEPHQYIIETKSSSPGGSRGEKILILDTKFRLFTI